HATQQSLKIVVYNLSQTIVKANMTVWDVQPGQWEMVQGVDTNGDDSIDGAGMTTTIELERSGAIELTFPPGASTVLNLRLVARGIPYWTRPDLGISKDDVLLRDKKLSVTIHSLGGVNSLPTTLALVDQSGKVLSSAPVPPLEAPADLLPRTTTITVDVPAGMRVEGCRIVIDPDAKLKE